jgi:hypothetical protein
MQHGDEDRGEKPSAPKFAGWAYLLTAVLLGAVTIYLLRRMRSTEERIRRINSELEAVRKHTITGTDVNALFECYVRDNQMAIASSCEPALRRIVSHSIAAEGRNRPPIRRSRAGAGAGAAEEDEAEERKDGTDGGNESSKDGAGGGATEGRPPTQPVCLEGEDGVCTMPRRQGHDYKRWLDESFDILPDEDGSDEDSGDGDEDEKEWEEGVDDYSGFACKDNNNNNNNNDGYVGAIDRDGDDNEEEEEEEEEGRQGGKEICRVDEADYAAPRGDPSSDEWADETDGSTSGGPPGPDGGGWPRMESASPSRHPPPQQAFARRTSSESALMLARRATPSPPASPLPWADGRDRRLTPPPDYYYRARVGPTSFAPSHSPRRSPGIVPTLRPSPHRLQWSSSTPSSPRTVPTPSPRPSPVPSSSPRRRPSSSPQSDYDRSGEDGSHFDRRGQSSPPQDLHP